MKLDLQPSRPAVRFQNWRGHLIMRTTISLKASSLSFMLAAALPALAGCAEVSFGTVATPALTAQTAIPNVQDCAMFSGSSPARFACGGKVYTAYQLALLREGAGKKASSAY
jgi:hypothetical protein